MFAVFATSIEPFATADSPVPPSATVRSVIPVIVPPVIATLELSKFAIRVAVVIPKSPVLAPVKVPVPTTNLSACSSQPKNGLLAEPLSITIPASFEGVPEVPVPNSNRASLTVVFVVEIVVVVPLTVKLPVIVTLFGSPIVIVLSDTVVSISLAVPAKLRVSDPSVTASF